MNFIQTHYWALPAAMFIVSAAVSNLPAPDSTSGKGYRWFYGTAHMVVGNIGDVITAVKPGAALPPIAAAQMKAQNQATKANSYADLGR